MALSADGPHQYKQPSRKGKKAWRKNVDVSEVQEGLENVREEVIRGGIIAEKPSEALFTLDTTGSEAIQKAYLKAHKPLRVDQILAQRSAIPAIDSRKRSGVTDGVIEPSSKRQKGNGLSRKEFQRLQDIASGGGKFAKDVTQTDGIPDADPWEDIIEQPDPKFSYLEKPKAVRAPSTLQRAPISLLANSKYVPAVQKPRAGISYNPVFQEWDQLLTKEGEKEVQAEIQRLREAEEEKGRLARIFAAQNERDDIQTDDESAWEGFESDFEGDGWLRKRRPERKTPSERNKAKKRKETERQAKSDARIKRKSQQAQRIKAIAKEIEVEQSAKSAAKEYFGDSNEEEFDDQVLRRRKLGRTFPTEPPLELVLPDELQDSLRLLKPEGNLLKDRFRSILVRGKVETRKPIQQPKKVRRGYTEKWTYKDFQIPTA